MTRTSTWAVVGLFTFVPMLALAQDLATSIVGVWKQTSLMRKDVATGNVSPFLAGALARVVNVKNKSVPTAYGKPL